VVFKSLLFRCYVTTVSQRRDTGYAEESIIIRVGGRETFSFQMSCRGCAAGKLSLVIANEVCQQDSRE